MIRTYIVSMLAASIALPVVGQGQVASSNADDARILPRGTLRFQLLNSWTRFDETLTGSGGFAVPLGAPLNIDSLGPRQIPALSASAAALRTLVGDPTAGFSIGRLAGSATARIVTTPIVLEYGLTKRLQLGISIPIVQTRTTLATSFNPSGTESNLGPNPAYFSGAVASADSAFVSQLNAAADALQYKLQNCPSTPTAPGCAAVLADPAAAQQLLQSSRAFSGAMTTLFGGLGGPGQPFVPQAASQFQVAINARIANFARQDSAFGVTGPVYTVPGAAGPAGPLQLQQLLSDPRFGVGADSLATRRRIGVGDIEIAAMYQLFDAVGDSTGAIDGGMRFRGAVRGAARLGTGRPASRYTIYDIGTGTGQTAFDAQGLLDVQLTRHVLASVGAGYTLQLGSAALPRAVGTGFLDLSVPLGATARKLGDVVHLDLTPRLLITRYLTVDGYYGVRHQGAGMFTLGPTTLTGGPTMPASAVVEGLGALTSQRAGFGVSYSALSAGAGALPLEVSFAHRETIRATGSSYPKYFEDQLRFRIYYAR